MEKAEILKIVAKFFKEKGYHNTSIKDISNAVGLEGGALYYYIKGKEQALFAIGEMAINDLLFQLERLNGTNLTPGEKLKEAIRIHVDFFINRFYETCVFLIETKALGPKFQQQYVFKRDKYERIWRKIIQDGIKAGEFRNVDVKLTTFAILGMLNWLVIWFKPNKGWSSEKVSKDFIKLISKGVLK